MKGTAILVTFRWLEDYKYILNNIKKIAQEEEDQNTSVIYAGGPITLGYIQTALPYIIMLFGVAILLAAVLLFIFFDKHLDQSGDTRAGDLLPKRTSIGEH